MAIRDIIPWRRQENTAPVHFQANEQNPLVQMRREMDRLMDDFFRWPASAAQVGGGAFSWPSLEVKERDDKVTVTAELPGLTEKDVEVALHNGMLTLRGEKRSEHEDKDRGWTERSYGRFERSIALPDGVDENSCTASFRDGLLTVSMTKSGNAARSRRIPIGTSETSH